MRTIIKGREPVSLTAHRKTPHCNYENYRAKDELRHSLITEQRGLCCYCMKRIRPEAAAMKIEHWKCREHYRGEELKYRNLLGACLGEQGKPARLQHCDTSKGDRDLKWNPADPTHHIDTRIRYELDGSIRSDEEDFDRQLNNVLNLNLPTTKNNRKHALDAVLQWWKSRKARIAGPVSRQELAQKRDQYVGGDGELVAYCQVAVWWLEQRLSRMAA